MSLTKDNFDQSRFKWISGRDNNNLNLEMLNNCNTSFQNNIGNINNKIELLNKDQDVKKQYYMKKLQDETLNITIDNSSQSNVQIHHKDYYKKKISAFLGKFNH